MIVIKGDVVSEDGAGAFAALAPFVGVPALTIAAPVQSGSVGARWLSVSLKRKSLEEEARISDQVKATLAVVGNLLIGGWAVHIIIIEAAGEFGGAVLVSALPFVARTTFGLLALNMIALLQKAEH